MAVAQEMAVLPELAVGQTQTAVHERDAAAAADDVAQVAFTRDEEATRAGNTVTRTRETATGPKVGDPVSPVTGALYAEETDIGGDIGLLAFTRTYASDRMEPGAMGPGWRHPFEAHVLIGWDPRHEETVDEILALRDRIDDELTAAMAQSTAMIEAAREVLARLETSKASYKRAADLWREARDCALSIFEEIGALRTAAESALQVLGTSDAADASGVAASLASTAGRRQISAATVVERLQDLAGRAAASRDSAGEAMQSFDLVLSWARRHPSLSATFAVVAAAQREVAAALHADMTTLLARIGSSNPPSGLLGAATAAEQEAAGLRDSPRTAQTDAAALESAAVQILAALEDFPLDLAEFEAHRLAEAGLSRVVAALDSLDGEVPAANLPTPAIGGSADQALTIPAARALGFTDPDTGDFIEVGFWTLHNDLERFLDKVLPLEQHFNEWNGYFFVHDFNENGRDEIIGVQQSGIGDIPMIFEYYDGAFKQTLTFEDPSRSFVGIEVIAPGELRIYGYGEPRNQGRVGFAWSHYVWNDDLREYEIVTRGRTATDNRFWLDD